MRTRLKEIDKNSLWRALSGVIGIAVNFLLSALTHKLGLPFYLDTAGTIVSAYLGGMFTGIMTAVATNILCSVFNPYSLYYTLISVLIAVCTSLYVRKHRFSKPYFIPIYILNISLMGGILGTLFQWALLGGPQFSDVAEISALIAGDRSGPFYFFASLLVITGLNLVDKGLTSGLALLVLHLIPKARKDGMMNSRWMQKPLTDEEIAGISRRAKTGRHSLQRRMTVMLAVTALTLALALSWISVMLSYETTKEEYKRSAIKAAEFTASLINPYMIENYLSDGRQAPGYEKIEDTMYKIRDSAPGVVYLYVVTVEDDGCRFVFDLEGDDGTEAFAPGEFSPFEVAFSEEVPKLKSGLEIEPIESNDKFGWLITAYYPVRNARGETVCYAGADASLSYASGFVSQYLLRVLLIFSGFFILIMAYGLWISGYFVIYPAGSMAAAVESFVEGEDDQETLDNNVRMIRALDIHTGDEIETLYNAVCRMASDTAEQMRGIRHYAEATAQMQNGLIVTMADMVESRDSDTGAHVQKTAAYVRIILEGLRRKGYYASKITPKYMSDVENSAPLHDVGKINVPDAVLNKPGKLDEKEFEIMKTHTTAGREIIEKAISTVKGGSYLKEARNMAGYHHERWDGKGYPEGLHGEVIPLSARIMAVADVFDALTSPRVYKPAFPLEKALEIINEGSGSQFDPKVVEVFMDSLPEVKVILKKYNNV